MSRPVVRLVFACESATLNPAGDKYTIENPLVVVRMPQGKVKGHRERQFAL